VYATGAFGQVYWGVQVNSVDYDLCFESFSQLAIRNSVSGFNQVAANVLDPGTYSCLLRWKTTGATGNIDGESNLMFAVTETT
jgi:hypothetical protein